MTEHPLPFSGAMARATLREAAAKTQTRRVMMPQPEGSFTLSGLLLTRRCPYGVPGDRLWVREAWRAAQRPRLRRD